MSHDDTSCSSGWRNNWSKMEEEDAIRVFGEGQPNDVSPDSLEEAEDEIKEKEDEMNSKDGESDDSGMPDLLRRWRCMEYATPAGSTGHGNCDGCADVGDVVIIDAGISDMEGDEDDPDADFAEEMSFLQLTLMRMNEPEPHMEGMFSSLLKELVGVLKTLSLKIVKHTLALSAAIRNKIMKTHMNLVHVHKIWEFKLSGDMRNLDTDRLNTYEVEAMSCREWIETSKTVLDVFDIIKSAERVVFDPASTEMTKTILHTKEMLERAGIEVNVIKNRVIFDNMLDKRELKSPLELGYTKSQLGTCNRYLGNMARCVPKKDEFILEKMIEKTTKRVTSYAASIQGAVEEGRLTKGSDEYKAELQKMMNYTVRLDFILSAIKIVYYTLNVLVNDILDVYTKYEKALTSKAIIDA